MTNRFLVATSIALTVICVDSTSAADLDSPKPPAEPALPPPPLWTGFYAGLNAGYAFDASPSFSTFGFPVHTGFTNFFSGTHAFASAASATGVSFANAEGPIGGGQVGFNYQFGGAVLGLEADIQGVGARGRGGFLGRADASVLGIPSETTAIGVENEKSLDWLGTVRGRVGYLVTPSLLGYATGGLAYGKATLDAWGSQAWVGTIGQFLQTPGAAGRLSDTLVGWTIGGGAEWAFAPNISVKAEYLYYDLGNVHFPSGALTTRLFSGLGDTIAASSRTRFDGHIARLGLNYHFRPIGAATPEQPLGPPPLWLGFYAGLNAGYSWDGSSAVFSTAIPGQADIDALFAPVYAGLSHGAASTFAATGTSSAPANGFVAGGQAGYNYRFERVVVGLEADIQGAGVKGRGGFLGAASASLAGGADTVLSAVQNEKTIDWLGTVRGRVGYLITPRLLGYASGGFAYGGVTAHSTLFSGWSGDVVGPLLQWSNSVGRFSDTRLGWTVGGGAEWAFSPNLSVKAEYLFYDLGDARFLSTPSTTGLFGLLFNTEVAVSRIRFEGHLARAGVNYHFNCFDAPPVIAKY